MLESTYQRRLIKKLGKLFPGCIIIKNDPTYIQGFPDLTIFFEDRWATLEVKPFSDAAQQPNQEHYVDIMNQMSFSAFIFPENEEEVLAYLQQAFGFSR